MWKKHKELLPVLKISSLLSSNSCILLSKRCLLQLSSVKGVGSSVCPKTFSVNFSTISEVHKEKKIAKKLNPISNDFSSLDLMDPIQESLNKVFKFEKMVGCQQPVLSSLPTAEDMLVKAKTGTGKTVAFLVAALEKLKNNSPNTWNAVLAGRHKVSILIIAPTRELAIQILAESQKICKFLPLKSVLICGGEMKRPQINNLTKQRCDIVVATPGRLLDILHSNEVMKTIFSKTRILILDEADRLLELGFKEEMEKIMTFLPTKERETLLFSATLNKETKHVAASTLKKNYLHIDCIPENEVESHHQIRQSYIISPFSQQLPLILDIIRKSKESNPLSKIIVFFPTANMVGYFSQVFNAIIGLEIIELHSRLNQIQRVGASKNFRAAMGGILFTTDVSARGIDYPDVTLILQVGIPITRDLYIHRVGRTGRAGKDGEAIMILSPYEKPFLKELNNLNVKEDVRHSPVFSASKKENIAKLQSIIRKAPKQESMECFFTWVGYMRGIFGKHKLDYEKINAASSEFAKHMLGIASPPTINKETDQKTRLHNLNEEKTNVNISDETGTMEGGRNTVQTRGSPKSSSFKVRKSTNRIASKVNGRN
ncbi:hypothetical protein HK099_004369 [Clydaea vesicula]|uniref:RNA helicase n=1 Tax=Clydaea vesicula TaxID=447962 RepID=A0AAD5Y0B3_9FUNG|nr:hypothetical protein HK099_004369 [Clydaea vesicula]